MMKLFGQGKSSQRRSVKETPASPAKAVVARPAAGRIRVFRKKDDIPQFRSILTRAGGELELSAELRSRLAVLDLVTKNSAPEASDSEKTGERQCLILTVAAGRDGAIISDLKAKLRRRGVKAASVAQIDPGLLQTLYEEDARSGGDKKNTDTEKEVFDLILHANAERASDIHVVRRTTDAAVYFRIDGEIYEVHNWTAKHADQLMGVAYRVLAVGKGDAKTWNTRKGQDASISQDIGGRPFRLRYSHYPLSGMPLRDDPNGPYHVALRVLDVHSGQGVQQLEELGFTKPQAELLRMMLLRPEGITLIAGTTGSGKSTTIKNGLGWLHEHTKGSLVMLSLENPVEYEIPGVWQSEVVPTEDGRNPFAEGLRYFMRQDPDLIMLGEVRDTETAIGVMQAAQTGHRVVTTLHAQNAIGCLPRLENLGIGRSVLGAPNFISGLVYQKLAPKLCKHCKVPLPLALERGLVDQGLMNRVARVVRRGYNIEQIFARNYKGCDHCRGGIFGRSVCAEVMLLDEVMLGYVSEGQYARAFRHWRRQRFEMELDNDEAGYFDPNLSVVGVTAMDHAVQKMLEGEVSPTDVESLFWRLGVQEAMEDEVLSQGEMPLLLGLPESSANRSLGS